MNFLLLAIPNYKLSIVQLFYYQFLGEHLFMTLSIKKIMANPIIRNSSSFTLYQPRQIKDDASHISKNIKFNRLSIAIFRCMDVMNPYLINHPKINKFVINTGEKILKRLAKIDPLSM